MDKRFQDHDQVNLRVFGNICSKDLIRFFISIVHNEKGKKAEYTKQPINYVTNYSIRQAIATSVAATILTTLPFF